MSINSVVLTGNLTRDCEQRVTNSGTTVVTFSLAVNDRRKNPQGDWEDVPNYIDCTLFGTRAASLAKYLVKGIKVGVHGKLRYSSWEKDGQKRSKLDVTVEDIELLSKKQGTPVTVYDDDVPF